MMTDTDDLRIEELLRAAGPRPPLPDEMKNRLEASFRTELLASRRKLVRRNMYLGAGLVASLVLTVMTYLNWQQPVSLEVIAKVQRSSGQTYWQQGRETGPLRSGNLVHTDDILRTAEGWLAISPPGSDIEIRLDRMTEVRAARENSIELISGSVYVDVHSAAIHQPFTIYAQGISIDHIGTQFMVSMNEQNVSVAVREGEVVIESKEQRIRGRATTDEAALVELDSDHHLVTSKIKKHGDRWEWASTFAPEIDTDGMSIGEFLNWIARETGTRILYTSAEARAGANERIVGTIPTGDVLQALDTAMSLTRFNAVIEDGVIIVRNRQ